jgi:hypothetical protein
MSRKMIGWIALAVFTVGALAFGLNSALGSEPAPSAKKASHAQTAPASVSSASKPTVGGAVSIAQKLFEAVQAPDNANNGGNSTSGPLNFISNLAKNHTNGK